jgi:adenosylmethionine-8-amino-7-oxononanoate aminotransferase
MEHVIFAGFVHQPAIDLSRRLLEEVMPEGFRKVFFSDNGSTAVEVGIKIAIQYWYNKGETQKTKMIALDGGYHGDTFGAMSLGGKNAFFKPFEPHMFDVHSLPFPDGQQDTEILTQFESWCKAGDVAAFIYEPLVQGSAGMRMYAPEVLDQLLRIARKHEVLCIADEVMTGFGRTGKTLSSEHMSTRPDIVCVSKGITAGYLPLGVTAIHRDIVEVFDNDDIYKAFYHGHSYTGNPMSCAVALASLDLLLSDETQQAIRTIQSRHESFRDHLQKGGYADLIKKVSVRGTIITVEIKTENSSYFNTLRDTIYHTGLEEGVLLRPLGNTMYLIPPYCITEEELNTCYKAIEKVLSKL